MNAFSLHTGIYLAVHHFRKQKSTSQSAIAITSSNAGIYAFPGGPNYCASKHALVGLTRALGPTLIQENVKICCVCPNAVATGFGKPEITQQLHLTPMCTVVEAFRKCIDPNEPTGAAFEASSDKVVKQDPPDFTDEAAKHNVAVFTSWHRV